jgi:cytochrome b6-f complex iron-sulfur subunit
MEVAAVSALGLAGLVIAGTLAAWLLFMAYLWARPEAAPRIGSILVPSQARPGLGQGSTALRVRGRRHDETAGVTRRQFLNRAYVAAVLVGLANFALASLDYLWPRAVEGAGGKNVIGDAERLRQQLEHSRTPIPYSGGNIPAPGFYLMTYEGEPAAANKIPAYVATNVAATGFVAMYRRCVHLGCTVPFCNTSEWLECPCHGSKYSINGEYRAGPAPRSLDRFAVTIVGGKVVVDTSTIITGPPRGTVTSQPQAEGPHCVNISGA